MPILASSLNKLKAMPSRAMQDIHEEEASVYSHDGTERPIRDPKTAKNRKNITAGKRKPIRSKTT